MPACNHVSRWPCNPHLSCPTTLPLTCSAAGTSIIGTPKGLIPASEFDHVIGHSIALTDAAGSCFALDLIRAYPDTIVVLSIRSDLDAWHSVSERWASGGSAGWM